MTLEDYLDQTKRAVTQLFKALQFYRKILKKAVHPPFAFDVRDPQAEPLDTRKLQEQCEELRERQQDYFGNFVSEGVICGSIIQIAYMGIQMFSTNELVPDNCQNLTKDSRGRTLKTAVKSCVGRAVSELPIGLIIYAARNQYNHMDEDSYSLATTGIFNRIASY